jgi:hypothetical protein
MRISMHRLLCGWVIVSLSACTCGGSKLKKVAENEPVADAGCVVMAETCNGVDDDCNGLVDDALPAVSCGVGACFRTRPSCVAGVSAGCTPLAPGAEVCDGKDNDCDGQTDEDLLPTMCGSGECAAVSPSCANGMSVACMPAAGVVEICDGKDNDCNGTVDEGLLANLSSDRRVTSDSAISDFVYASWSGTQFGLVWQDKRDGAAMSGEIYFAALDKNGVRLNPQDVRITQSTGVDTHPALAWNGTRYGLVYANNSVGNYELYFQLLEASGLPVGGPVRITTAVNSSDWPDVVWTGTAFAVAWEDERAGVGKEDVYFQKLDANGNKLGTEVRVTTDPARQMAPILKWTGAGFGVAWSDTRFTQREIYFRKLDANGMPVGTETRVTNDAADSAWPDLAWNGTDWAVVWHDLRDGNSEVYLTRLSAAGQKISADLRLTNAAGFSGYPSIDWNGFQYGVSWQDDRAGTPAIYFAQVSQTGIKNGPDLKVSSGTGSSSFTTALWNGSTFAFAWRDDRDAPNGNTELYFAYVGCP